MKAAIALLLAVSSAVVAQTYDVVIRNGHVLDGAGNPWIAADVAITSGKFAKIGKVTGHGRREIDVQPANTSLRAG